MEWHLTATPNSTQVNKNIEFKRVQQIIKSNHSEIATEHTQEP